MDFEKWTTFLEKVGINDNYRTIYAEQFVEEYIDESTLIYLQDRDLKEMGITIGHRIKIINYIRNEYSVEKEKVCGISSESAEKIETEITNIKSMMKNLMQRTDDFMKKMDEMKLCFRCMEYKLHHYQ